jgi:hypothetical protein
MNIRVCDGTILAAGQGATDAMWSFHIRREQRRPAARIARPFGLRPNAASAALSSAANGTAIGNALRLASIRIGMQRITRIFMK